MEQTGRARAAAHDVGDPSVPEGLGTMLDTWWNANMDARRSISLVVAAVGSAVIALGIAASPDSWALGSTYAAFIVPGLIGAGIGGYRRHRASDPSRAPLWGLASGALVSAMMVATLGTALLIRPTVRGIPGLEGAWAAVLMGGVVVGFVGALLWERDVRRHHFEALLSLAVLLIVGGLFLQFSGDPWALLGAFVSLGGFGVLVVAFESYRRSSRQDAAVPDTWR